MTLAATIGTVAAEIVEDRLNDAYYRDAMDMTRAELAAHLAAEYTVTHAEWEHACDAMGKRVNEGQLVAACREYAESVSS